MLLIAIGCRLLLPSNGVPPWEGRGAGVNPRDSRARLHSAWLPQSPAFQECAKILFFSFEKVWSEVLSSERANLVLSLVVPTRNIVIVLKIIVLTFKKATRIWAGLFQWMYSIKDITKRLHFLSTHNLNINWLYIKDKIMSFSINAIIQLRRALELNFPTLTVILL